MTTTTNERGGPEVPHVAAQVTVTRIRLGSAAPRDAYRMHQAIAAATESPDTPTMRVLWAWPTPDLLLIQSADAINVDRIPGVHRAATSVTSTVHAAGATVRIGLIGNPVRTVSPTSRACRERDLKTGRFALPVSDRLDWLRRKLAGTVTVTDVSGQPLPAATGKRGIVIARHLFTGTGIVDDPTALAQLICAGVGAGKGMGCGLLLIGATR